MAGRILAAGGLLAAAAWQGGFLGFLLGLLGSFVFWMLIGTVDREGLSATTLAKVLPHVGVVTGLWFGSWAGANVVDSIEWADARDWYLGVLATTTGILVVPMLAVFGWKVGRGILRA